MHIIISLWRSCDFFFHQGAFELGVLEGICKNHSLKHLRCNPAGGFCGYCCCSDQPCAGFRLLPPFHASSSMIVVVCPGHVPPSSWPQLQCSSTYVRATWLANIPDLSWPVNWHSLCSATAEIGRWLWERASVLWMPAHWHSFLQKLSALRPMFSAAVIT